MMKNKSGNRMVMVMNVFKKYFGNLKIFFQKYTPPPQKIKKNKKI